MKELETIAAVIAEYFGLTYTEIVEPGNRTELAYPKQLFCHFAVSLPDVTLNRVGKMIGVTHGSVHRSNKLVKGWLDVDPSVKKDVNAIKIMLQRPTAYSIIKEVLGSVTKDKIEELAQVVENWKRTNDQTWHEN